MSGRLLTARGRMPKSRTRRQEKAVAEFQGIQSMLADMAMQVAAARQLTYAAAARSERVMAGEAVGDLTFMGFRRRSARPQR